MANAVLSTLRHVTDRKLERLSLQIEKFDANKAAILTDAEAEGTASQQVKALLDGCKKHGVATSRTGMSVKNVKRFLAQAENDPSVSNALLEEWKSMLQNDLEIQGRKFEYASLFGRLVTEWIQNPNDAAAQPDALRHNSDLSGSESESTTSPESEPFEHIGRKEMHEQRQQWEAYSFAELKRDQEAIDKYLKDLFSFSRKSKKLKTTPLHQLQVKMGKFDEMEPKHFTVDVVRWCIAGVIKSDLFAGEKREALIDLKSRPTILKEMADVLNIDLDSIESWKWDPAPVQLTMRRQLNGKYRVYYDEEIHQALLLHFIGAKWAVFMKEAFTAFFHSGAWTQAPYRAMDKKSRQRREYFLGPSRGNSAKSVNYRRRLMYQNDFFMTQLPCALDAGMREYGDEDGWAGAGEDNLEPADSKSPLEIKESMHRLATTELLINTKLYGEFTFIQSDFKWFGPSMPHDTIFAVLKFLGVKGKWLGFFRKYLQTPVVWSQDGPQTASSSVVVRKRGIPMSHALSDALGEAVLFCLDFAVSGRTGGSDLYRFHDDLTFFGQESTCIKAWQAMVEFADMMGLELNEEKTGCVQIFEDPSKARHLPRELPKGDITWGFLQLDPTKGRWIVDEKKVEEHIAELRRQLKACRSVLAWIQAWNSYACRFFATNMGTPANCFGVSHINMVTNVFVKIQRSLLSDSSSEFSVTEHLRKLIGERFGTLEIPDGFFYFPLAFGGLELRNPFITLSALRDTVPKMPEEKILRAFEDDEEDYENARKRYESGDCMPSRAAGGYQPEDDEPFMSLEEFARFREETSAHLLSAYDGLLKVPQMSSVEQTASLTGTLYALTKDPEYSIWSWDDLDAYWRWVFELYGMEMVQKFAGLSIGEKSMLPLGLVGMLKSERTRWLG